MSRPIVIHVLRPYANEEEYLAHERSTIDPKTMLLIDQPPLPLETAVVFDVTLSNGEKPIRAEAKVIAHVSATAEYPGGLRVRFKRYGAATKSFIERAVRASGGSMPAASATSLMPPAEVMPSLAPGRALLDETETSGIHRKVVAPVAPPANRDDLLSKLRARASARKQSA